MKVYIGTFLIAFATLALEITLTRLLSVTTWYHLAFFAIATAMLGMTAGAVLVYLKPSWFPEESVNRRAATASLCFGLVVPFVLLLLCLLPLNLTASAMGLGTLLTATFFCSLPFFLSGIAITLVLTKCDKPIGLLYASDLIGAAFGCLFVLGGLELVDAPSLILFCAAVGVLAAIGYSGFGGAKAYSIVFVLLAVFATANSTTSRGIRPAILKGKWHPAHWFMIERWNSFSCVNVDELSERPAFYWGKSPVAPERVIPQYYMRIDGGAGTPVSPFTSIDELDYLEFDVTNMVHWLRPTGESCVIGVGGGRDIQSALYFGHSKVTGIEINPIFIDLLNKEFRQFANLADRDDVELIVDEARSYLSRSTQKFSVIQMSLIDTWAATGAGAFALSENSLYTREAWKVFTDRLAKDGIFTVSRWYNPEDLGETGRLLSLAVATMLDSGISAPARHIALITSDRVATLLLSREPFTSAEISRLNEICNRLAFDTPVIPETKPMHDVLREIVGARSIEELKGIAKDGPLRFDPPTDESPYFFNNLRIGKIGSLDEIPQSGQMRGNIIATVTLVGLIVSLLITAIVTIVAPLLLRSVVGERKQDTEPILWSGALYFSLIGVGFMLTEIGMIQKLTVLLSHPTYALGILLFSIILSSGAGSFVSEKVHFERGGKKVILLPLVACGIILGTRILVGYLLVNTITQSMSVKILASVGVIAPLGFILGWFFPVGMRLVRAIRPGQTPWYWALNGIFGVLASAVAVFLSIFFGTSLNFYVAAACYLMTAICIWNLIRQQNPSEGCPN